LPSCHRSREPAYPFLPVQRILVQYIIETLSRKFQFGFVTPSKYSAQQHQPYRECQRLPQMNVSCKLHCWVPCSRGHTWPDVTSRIRVDVNAGPFSSILRTVTSWYLRATQDSVFGLLYHVSICSSRVGPFVSSCRFLCNH